MLSNSIYVWMLSGSVGIEVVNAYYACIYPGININPVSVEDTGYRHLSNGYVKWEK